jgi:hypothetical protein
MITVWVLGSTPGMIDERERQDEEGLDDAPQHVVEHAAVVAHQEAEQRAEGHAEDGGERRRDQHVPRAHHDARQHVTAQLIGAEHVPVRERRHVAHAVRRERIVRRDRRAADRADHPDADDRQADDRRRAAEEQPHLLVARLLLLRR